MKKFKKLIPALCMLLVSAVMLGTTTFAWFSMNNKVTANNMSVTAKSNSTYLQISKTSASATDFGNEATMNSTKNVYPCAFTTTEIAAADGNNAKIEANNFYTANNTKSDGKGDVVNRKLVAMAENDYLSVQKVYLKLTADSLAYNNKELKLTFTKVSGHDSVKAVVKVGEEYVALASDSTTGTFNSVTITSTQALEVTIFVYIDGTNKDVISDYINAEATKNNLTGAINIGFEIVVD